MFSAGSGAGLLWTGMGQVRFVPKVVLQNGLIPLLSEINLVLAPNDHHDGLSSTSVLKCIHLCQST